MRLNCARSARQILRVGQLSPRHAGDFVPRVAQRRAQRVVDLDPAFLQTGDGETDDRMVEVGVKPLDAGALCGKHRILRGGQGLLVDQLLFVIAKDQTEQHGGERIEQQQYPPRLLDEGIPGPIGYLRECGQLHQLHHDTEQQIVHRAWRAATTQQKLPGHHAEQRREQHDHDANRRTDAAQLVAKGRRHAGRNHCSHATADDTDHRQHNRTAIKEHAG
jgi:hypothetical protein